MADKIKFALALVLLAAGVAGFYLLSEQAMILRVLAVLVGLALAVVVAWKTEPGQRFFLFGNEAVVEAKKVVWSTRKENMQTTRKKLKIISKCSLERIFNMSSKSNFDFLLFYLYF